MSGNEALQLSPATRQQCVDWLREVVEEAILAYRATQNVSPSLNLYARCRQTAHDRAHYYGRIALLHQLAYGNPAEDLAQPLNLRLDGRAPREGAPDLQQLEVIVRHWGEMPQVTDGQWPLFQRAVLAAEAKKPEEVEELVCQVADGSSSDKIARRVACVWSYTQNLLPYWRVWTNKYGVDAPLPRI
ncbi:MAG TPA: hypothetical protein VLI05_02815 [Candidatus Saccharimonadia bacterium]|nr:hypothetical protein [Candidatus Saccharimonadia bacterium]